MDVAEELKVWWVDLERSVRSRWDLLLFVAHRKLRHPPAEGDPDEEVDDTVRQQQAEARALAQSS